MEKKAIYVTFWLITQTYRYIDISITFFAAEDTTLARTWTCPTRARPGSRCETFAAPGAVPCTDSHPPRVHNRARIGRSDARRIREAGARLALGDGEMISAADDIAPVLAREVNWDALLASRLVSETDVRLVKSYDKQDADARNAILTEVRAATTPDAASRLPPPPPRPASRAPRPFPEISRATTASFF